MTAVWFWLGVCVGYIWAVALFGLMRKEPHPTLSDVCPACYGSGYDSSGQRCERCQPPC